MAEPRPGMTSLDGLWRLLRLRGVTCPRQELKEQLGEAPSTLEMIEELLARDIPVRAAQIQGRDLPHLELPTLVQFRDETWALLLAETPEGLQVDLGSSTEVVRGDVLADRISGTALDLSPGLPPARSYWTRWGLFLLRSKRPLLMVAAASLLLQLMALVVPLITRVAMDRALPEGAASFLKLVALGVLAATAFQAWVGWVRERLILFLETRLEVAAQRGFLEHLLSLPFSLLHRKPQGDLLQGFYGLGAARDVVTERLLGALLDGVLALTYLVAMGAIMPAATGVVALAALLMASASALLGSLQARLQLQETEAQSRQRGFLVELLMGVATLKAAGAEFPTFHRWMGRLRVELALSLRRQRLGLWSEIGLDGLRQGLMMSFLIWGGLLALEGTVKVGALMAFLQMATAFFTAVLGVANAYLSLVLIKPQVKKTMEILEAEPAPRSSARGSRELAAPVVMEDVWFRYSPSGPWILKGFSMRVDPGQKFWLKGPSGFGKSTVLRLLAGLYEPERGHISVGGLEPKDARRMMVYLPQTVQLYGGSLQENLALLSCQAPRDRIEAAAEASGLEALVSTFPMGYETVIPQGGGNLSGGQRQLAALTAAMASDRGLLLLDEAMANLDWKYRAALIHSPWFQGKTIVYASHDIGFGLPEGPPLPEDLPDPGQRLTVFQDLADLRG